MFGKIILTAMLTTSSATAEDAGKNIASGLATASTRQIGQAIMPTLAIGSAIAKSAGKGMVLGFAETSASYISHDDLSATRSYQNPEAVDMAKGLGTLKDVPDFLYVITDVNANMA
ncbi:TPA: hypothetical protein HH715_004754, partial [Escherichia coli]|nr:hypothetical protein [Escherichia coli]